MNQKLLTILQKYPRLAVAFSGGVDSTVLLRAALETHAAEDVLAVTAVSPSLPEGEAEAISCVAAELGVTHRVVQTDELADEDYRRNDEMRCYYCKRRIFRRLWEEARSAGYEILAEGSNADDGNVWRPGRKALAECGVASPLAEAGMTKAEVRELAREWGLSVAEKPASPCLATRFAYGMRLTAEGFRMVDEAERVLRRIPGNAGVSPADLRGDADAGGTPAFPGIRVRVHEGGLARIELPPEYFPLVMQEETRRQIVAEFRRLGFRFVTLDVEGFRSGSFD